MKLVRRCIAVAAFLAAILPAGNALAAEVSPTSVLSVSFSDALHGYLAGGYTGTDGVVAVTSDGGATWRPTQKPTRRFWAIASGVNGTAATSFADYYDEAFRTTNSGVIWSTTTPVFGGVPEYAGDTHISDAAYLQQGRVAVGEQHGTTWGNAAIIARDTGSSWSKTFYPAQTRDSNDDPIKKFAKLTSIDAASGGLVAWVVGAQYNDQSNVSPMGSLVYRTGDGGLNWTLEANTASTAEFYAVTAADDTNAYAIVRSTGTGLGSRYPYRRSAAGIWNQVPQIAPLNYVSPQAIDAFDANHVVVVGDNPLNAAGSNVYYSANAAAATPTWTKVVSGTSNDLYDVQMTGPDSWVAVGGNETVLRFTNGGANVTGSNALASPVVSFVTPVQGFTVPAPAIITGTAVDAGVGVTKVELRISNQNNQYWNGSSWVASSNTWNLASGTTSWSLPFAPTGSPTALAITARATDGMNQVGIATVNSTGASVDSVDPVTTAQYQASYTTPVNATIVMTATDNIGGSGVDSISYREGSSGAFTEVPGASVTRPVKTTPGTYTLYYYATDIAANQEVQKSLTYTVSNPSALSSVYRFYNKKNGSHFYTTDPAEKANTEQNLSATYKYEAVVYRVSPVQVPGSTPVYRFYNKKNGSHFYTTDPAEKANTQQNLSAIYKYEAIVYYVMSGPSAGTTPVYRFYNKKNGSHFYTTDPAEKANTEQNLSATYKYEAIVYYVTP